MNHVCLEAYALKQSFFYKHMKFPGQARVCLAVHNFQPQIMPIICLCYHGVWSTISNQTFYFFILAIFQAN